MNNQSNRYRILYSAVQGNYQRTQLELQDVATRVPFAAYYGTYSVAKEKECSSNCWNLYEVKISQENFDGRNFISCLVEIN